MHDDPSLFLAGRAGFNSMAALSCPPVSGLFRLMLVSVSNSFLNTKDGLAGPTADRFRGRRDQASHNELRSKTKVHFSRI
ncbi:hypothetical protein MPLDJ20_50181 [Mesorhizobium plurifarium]|uniref:Uncharacterized protein n=1 Tax=Mesorhizobium plurifarium TaxID=69974 RepID=A0A090FFV6_MESPL|nr:hypothetical protein MPLDJ20_50181 [Mesorhizobium plurifarium]